MCPTLVIKNTFICAVGAEALSPPSTRRRSRSDDIATSPPPAAALGTDGFAQLAPAFEDGAERCDAPVAEEVACRRAQSEAGGDAHSSWAGAATTSRCAELARALEVDGEVASAAVAAIRSSAPALAMDAQGAKVVQRALEVATVREARALAEALRGNALEAAWSPHAHHVLEEVVRRLSTDDAAFIAEELATQARRVVLSVYGCSVVCRLLEYSGTDPRTAALVEELLSADIGALCCHKYGHQVAMSILSNGLPHQRDRVLAALSAHLQRYARHRFACRVVEHALLQGPAGQCDLAAEVVRHVGTVVSLACHGFGVQVVRTLLQIPSISSQVKESLCKGGKRVLKDKYGLELVRELGLGAQVAAALAQAACVGGA